MPQNQQLDSGELRSLAIPYNVNLPDLTNDIVLVAGQDCWVTAHGKLGSRPGTALCSGTALSALGSGDGLTGRTDRWIIYETLDVPARIYIVISAWNAGFPYQSGTWSVWFLEQGSAASIGWQVLPNLRAINFSVQPHVFQTSNGKLYIKGFPNSPIIPAGDPLCSVIFNGSTQQTSPWGMLGPTTPAAVQPQAGWAASSHPVLVVTGWYYTYTFKDVTGHESNRAPLQQNPSQPSSGTGPFANLCPQVAIVGPTDPVNFPTIVIYRTTDGGGTFYKLIEIPNNGTAQVYTDNDYPDGNTPPNYPTPDSTLDTTLIAPTLNSNSPPPTVISQGVVLGTLQTSITAAATTINITASSQPNFLALFSTLTIEQEQLFVTGLTFSGFVYLATVIRGQNGTAAAPHSSSVSVSITPVVGLDKPVPCTPMVAYAGRLWYAIGNVLFYSANEELTAGVPQEAWPTGVNGNFYRLAHPVQNLLATEEALYVITSKDTLWVRGTARSTFQIDQLFADIGGAPSQPLAATTSDRNAIWLTSDYRLVMTRGAQRSFLSEPLGPGWAELLAANNLQLQLARYQWIEKNWLICNVLPQPFNDHSGSTHPLTTAPQQFIFDFEMGDGGWLTPWSMPASCILSGIWTEENLLADIPRLFIANYSGNGAFSVVNKLLVDVPTTMGDYKTTGTAYYPSFFRVSLLRNPTGNHINALRLPGFVSTINSLKLDTTNFTGGTLPSVTYALDDRTFAAPLSPPIAQAPPRRPQSVGYTTTWYSINAACERITAAVATADSTHAFEVQGMAYLWDPEAGA